MVTTVTRTYKTHLACGGRLRYAVNELGFTGYYCDSCGYFYPKSKKAKGGSYMPFPADAKRASDVAEGQALQLSKWEGGELLLKSYTITETYSLGLKALLFCEDEDGNAVHLFTFSKVVIEQLDAIKGDLPDVIITPQDMGTYQAIY